MSEALSLPTAAVCHVADVHDCFAVKLLVHRVVLCACCAAQHSFFPASSPTGSDANVFSHLLLL
jgi:hypothetical protein